MSYFIKLAENWGEIREAQILRTNAFGLERLDSDEYDDNSDHLLLYEEKKLIGTMRLRQSKSSNAPFYISQEFKLNGFEKRLLNHNFLEIGRLCTLKGSYRYSPLMLLATEFEYAKSRGIENFVGCTSFYQENLNDAEEIFSILEKQGKTVSKENLIKVKEDYKAYFYAEKQKKENIKIPSLAEIYFEAGAKIISEPAIDREFNCVDYLMAGNVKNIPKKFERVFNYSTKNLIFDNKIFEKTLIPIWKEKQDLSITQKIMVPNTILRFNQKRLQKKFQKRYELTA